MVYVLLGTGFEETEAVAPVDLLRRSGVPVMTVGVNGKVIQGSHGLCVSADIELGEVDPTDMEMVVLPGGMRGVASVRACPQAMALLRFAWENGKYVAAICAGPTVLADLHITDGKKATCYPGLEESMGSAVMVPGVDCIRDGNLITGTSAGCAIAFGLELVSTLKGAHAADTVRQQIVIR